LHEGAAHGCVLVGALPCNAGPRACARTQVCMRDKLALVRMRGGELCAALHACMQDARSSSFSHVTPCMPTHCDRAPHQAHSAAAQCRHPESSALCTWGSPALCRTPARATAAVLTLTPCRTPAWRAMQTRRARPCLLLLGLCLRHPLSAGHRRCVCALCRLLRVCCEPGAVCGQAVQECVR
jgi:hypothetical protein